MTRSNSPLTIGTSGRWCDAIEHTGPLGRIVERGNMTTYKIAALIRTQSGPALSTLSSLVAAHLNLFGRQVTVVAEEELVATRDENSGRILRLELASSVPASYDPNGQLRAVEQSLAQVAKRAGVQATFELFAAKAAEEVK